MYYPKTVPQGLVWLLLGLCGGGTWPALRQAIKSVDFEVFNLGFIVSMSGTGIALLSLLSLIAPITGQTRDQVCCSEDAVRCKNDCTWCRPCADHVVTLWC